MTPFALLLDRCGLSLREAALVCGIRPDTAASMSSGRNRTPPGVLAELRALYAAIERAAAEALTMVPADAGEIELGLARDDAEAQSLGWPCVGAQAAMLGLVAARLDRPCRVVPRGSTPATQAAAQAHRQPGF